MPCVKPKPHPAAPYRKVRLEQPDLEVTRRADGSILIHPVQPLGPYPDRMTDRLVYWAQKTPDVTLFAGARCIGRLARISYAQALNYARSIGEALLGRNLSAERPVAILSGQRSRTRDDRARLPACRYRLCADFAGLFAGLDRFRKAQAYLQSAHARPRVRVRRGGLRPRDRDGGAKRCRTRGDAQSAVLAADRDLRATGRRPIRPRRSTPPTATSIPTRSRNSCSPPARPASRRP